MNNVVRFVVDIVERAISTFLEAFAASYMVAINTHKFGFLECLVMSVGAALAAVTKGLTAGAIGVKGTAAVLPAAADAATAVVGTVGDLVSTVTEPIPGLKQVGDATDAGLEKVTDAIGDAAVAGANAVVKVGDAVVAGMKKVVKKGSK